MVVTQLFLCSTLCDGIAIISFKRDLHFSHRSNSNQIPTFLIPIPILPTDKAAKVAGREVYFPETFDEMVRDAAVAVELYIRDGGSRMEVEFPAVPGNVDGYKGSSDTFIDSNIQFAIAAARYLNEAGRKVHIVVPDEGELARSERMFSAIQGLSEGEITLGCLSGESGVEGGLNDGWASGFFKVGTKEPKEDAGAAQADVFIVANVSTIELPAVQQYTEKIAKGRPIVLLNLELDTLRGDLGLFAFPKKDLQHEFLSGFKPVFYLRPRDYSKSVNVSPFIINYSGALFREYPGPWQVMLKVDDGRLCCVAEDDSRYNLGEFKEELMAAMGLNTEEEGSAEYFLRRGSSTSTWWEQDIGKDKFDDWRT